MRTAQPTDAPGRIRTTSESGSASAARAAPALPAGETLGGVVALSRAKEEDAARAGEGGVSEAAPDVEGAPPDRRDERSAARAAASSNAAALFATFAAAFALLASSSPPPAEVGEALSGIDAAAADAACGSGAGDAASAAGEAACGVGESVAAADTAVDFGS